MPYVYTANNAVANLLKAYQRLHDGISDMVESGRLTPSDIPEDYQWLVESLSELTALDADYNASRDLRRDALKVAHNVEVNGGLCGLRLNAPAFFDDPAFKDWLDDKKTTTFTWHEKGTPVSEWSDVCVLVDPSLSGEGADADMPQHIWSQIVALCHEHVGENQKQHIPVWISNTQ